MRNYFITLILLLISSSVYSRSYCDIKVINQTANDMVVIKDSGWATQIPAFKSGDMIFKTKSSASVYVDDNKRCDWYIKKCNVTTLTFSEDATGHFICRAIK